MAKKRKLQNILQQVIFIGPALSFFSIIVLAPFIMGIGYSLTSWNGVADTVKFVGLDNFTKLLSDAQFWKSLWFTSRFSIASVLLTNIVGFGLALLLTKKLKYTNVYRTIFFMPNVIAGLLLGFIWQFIFIKGFAAIGEITNWGFFNLPWLGTEATAFWAIVIVNVWQQSGYLMIIYIAGLMNVPSELIEASVIDGASGAQVLQHIKLPMIMPSITVCLFLAISNAFKMFDLNFALTKGGPFNSTKSLALDIYAEAFENNRYGLGTAKAVVFFVIVAGITLLQVSITKRKEIKA